MNELYERGYRKIAMVEELRLDEPKIYRTGGAFLLLLRSRFGVRVADVTGCDDTERTTSSRSRIAAAAERLGSADALTVSWSEAIDSKPLPAEVREGEVWVCVDDCAS